MSAVILAIDGKYATKVECIMDGCEVCSVLMVIWVDSGTITNPRGACSLQERDILRREGT